MTFRFATWNIEWFNRLFDDDGALLPTTTARSAHAVPNARRIAAIGMVLRRIDADAILVVEAPDDGPRRAAVPALETFAAAAGLRTTRAILGFPNQTRQELALLYDPARVTSRHAPGDTPEAPRFDGEFGFDLDTDLRAERLVWSKPPIELDLDTPVGPIHLIGVHAKSKGAHGIDDPEEALRVAILNRRKQLGQCIWLRRRVDARLADGHDLIVAGDFNDGPGLDRFESLFGRSGVEVVLGDGDTALFDPSARPPRIGAAQPATARFWDRTTGRYANALLDFAMVGPTLRDKAIWRILHPFDDPDALAEPELSRALLDASDHFPVVLDLTA